MLLLSCFRQTLSILTCLGISSLNVLPILATTEVSGSKLTTTLLPSESLTQLLLTQRSFSGFTERYGPAPHRRDVAASRGLLQGEITALFPTEDRITDSSEPENIGQERTWYTAQAYPILFLHVSENSALTAEVVIEDSQENIVYSAVVELPDQNVSQDNPRPRGFIGIDLSQNATDLQTPPLEPSETYLWKVQLILDQTNPSANPFVTGWITRIDDTENNCLNNLINSENNSEIPWIYAENGIWYSTLSSIASNYLEQSDSQDWITLLNSVGYNQIANDPILGIAEVKKVVIGDLPAVE